MVAFKRLFILKTVLFDGHLIEKVTSPRAWSAILAGGPVETCSISCVLLLCCLTLEICSQTKYFRRCWPLRHAVGVEFSRLGLF